MKVRRVGGHELRDCPYQPGRMSDLLGLAMANGPLGWMRFESLLSLSRFTLHFDSPIRLLPTRGNYPCTPCLFGYPSPPLRFQAAAARLRVQLVWGRTLIFAPWGMPRREICDYCRSVMIARVLEKAADNPES